MGVLWRTQVTFAGPLSYLDMRVKVSELSQSLPLDVLRQPEFGYGVVREFPSSLFSWIPE